MTTDIPTMTVQEIQAELMDTNDGPVTDFVAIRRAVEMVYSPFTTADNIANALHEALKVIYANEGRISSTEFVR